MTQPRIPDTFPDAMTKIVGLLGVAATIKAVNGTGRRRYSERTIYEWMNPNSGTLPSLRQALALDVAYQLAGGEDAPFRDAYAQQLGIVVERQDACRRALVADSIDFIREASELHAALFSASQPGASPRDHHRAMSEVQQVDGVLRRIRRRLPNFLRSVTSTGPGRAGGTNQP